MLVLLTNIPTPYRTAFFNTLSSVLKDKGMDFHVIYCAKTEPRRFWDFHPNDNKYTYTFLSGWHLNFKNYYPHFNIGLIKTLSNLKPKYLIIAGSWNAPSTINVLLNRNKINAKLIFWSEGHQSAQRSSNQFIGKIRRKIFSSFNAFVVPNEKSKAYVKSLNEKAPVGFLPNTIDEDFYKAVTNKYEIDLLKKKYNLYHLSKIFISVATLSERKGVFDLLEAYNSLNTLKKKEIGLIFVGTGELIEKMESYKATHKLENVYLFGHQEESVVKDLMIASDIFVLPTRLDPNPLTPLEASFMKKPLILSRYAGNFNELLIQDKNGCGLNSIDKHSILESLEFFTEKSKEEIIQMGEYSYHNVKVNFTRLSAANSLINFLHTL